jgi:hypothetical protein
MEFKFTEGVLSIEEFIKWVETMKAEGFEEVTINGTITASK